MGELSGGEAASATAAASGSTATNGSFGLRLVHADNQLLVLDKPAGLLCVPGRGADKQDCLSARVQREFADALIVHRLDQATSGLCVFARGAHVQREMSSLFANREVTKRYVAVVAGRLQSVDGQWSLIDLPIAADWPRRPLRVIDASGQPSQTLWRAIAYDATSNCTRIELQPLTGRTHQLRVHLQAIGHPIFGDALYAPQPVHDAAARLLLHAEELSFTHPGTGRAFTVCTPAPF